MKKIKNLGYIMKYIWNTKKSYILFRIPEIILNAFKPFIMVIFPKLIIDELTMGDATADKWQHIMQIIMLMILLNFTVNVLLRILNTCITNAYNSFSCRHTVNVGQKIMTLEYQNIENPEILDLFERTKDAEYCEALFSSIANIISDILTCLGLIVVLAKMNIIVVCVIVLVVIINMKCNQKIQKYEYDWHVEAAPYKRISYYITNMMQNFQYGKDIRIFNEAKYIINKYNKFRKTYLHKLYTITIRFLKLNLLTTIVNVFQQGGIYFYLAYSVFRGEINLGTFTMFLNSIDTFTNTLIDISNNVVNIGNSTRYVEEFRQIMEFRNMREEGTLELKSSNQTVIEFKNVWFKYPGSEQYTLKNINAKWDMDKIISIVGTNGSGKTTFIKLLLRLYRPTKGVIMVNDVDINDIKYESYISLFSSVFQDFNVSAYSIRENIALQEDCDTDSKIISILRELNLYDKVMKLPKGLETNISKEFDENGILLSGGEQQKVAIARALYRNSRLLILDEPTSALDPLMEYEIYHTILNGVKDRGIVFISHRLSVTKFSDNVIVFNQGQIIQNGTHESLMKDREGLYYEMYDKQAEFYRDKVIDYECGA